MPAACRCSDPKDGCNGSSCSVSSNTKTGLAASPRRRTRLHRTADKSERSAPRAAGMLIRVLVHMIRGGLLCRTAKGPLESSAAGANMKQAEVIWLSLCTCCTFVCRRSVAHRQVVGGARLGKHGEAGSAAASRDARGDDEPAHDVILEPTTVPLRLQPVRLRNAGIVDCDALLVQGRHMLVNTESVTSRKSRLGLWQSTAAGGDGTGGGGCEAG